LPIRYQTCVGQCMTLAKSEDTLRQPLKQRPSAQGSGPESLLVLGGRDGGRAGGYTGRGTRKSRIFGFFFFFGRFFLIFLGGGGGLWRPLACWGGGRGALGFRPERDGRPTWPRVQRRKSGGAATQRGKKTRAYGRTQRSPVYYGRTGAECPRAARESRGPSIRSWSRPRRGAAAAVRQPPAHRTAPPPPGAVGRGPVGERAGGAKPTC